MHLSTDACCVSTLCVHHYVQRVCNGFVANYTAPTTLLFLPHGVCAMGVVSIENYNVVYVVYAY